MTEKLVDTAQREKFKAEEWDKWVNLTEKSMRLIVEEGLWIGMAADIMLVTGEVHSTNPILFAQREALVNLFGLLDKIATKDIPVIGDLNPIGLLNAFVGPLGILVSLTKPDDGTITKVVPISAVIPTKLTPVFGVVAFFLDAPDITIPLGTKKITRPNYFYPAIPLQYRVIVGLMVPGILRTIFGFLSSSMKLP